MMPCAYAQLGRSRIVILLSHDRTLPGVSHVFFCHRNYENCRIRGWRKDKVDVVTKGIIGEARYPFVVEML